MEGRRLIATLEVRLPQGLTVHIRTPSHNSSSIGCSQVYPFTKYSDHIDFIDREYEKCLLLYRTANAKSSPSKRYINRYINR